MTREELIAICESGSVPERLWYNRDSAEAQKQMGQCWAWLKAGCEFRVHGRTGDGEDDVCVSDESTTWVTVRAEGFQFHEWAEDESKDEETFYLPTRAALEKANGEDWYNVRLP